MDNVRDEDKTKVRLLEELKRLRKENERLQADSTSLTLTEKNLMKLTLRYEAILDAIPDIIIEADVNNKCVLANRAGIEFFGEEVLGKETAFYFKEEQNADETVQSLFGGNDKDAAHVKNWHERKDNEKRLLAWRYQKLKDKNGNETGVLFFARDITDNKLFEEDLQKLSSAVKQSPCAIIITDAHGTIEYVNPKFTQLTGYSLKEAIGKNPRILQSGQTPPETYKHLWTTIFSGDEWYGVFCNKKKNGELYWEKVFIAPVKNSKGDITHFIAIKEDITKQKKLEEDLRKSKENLAYAQRIARLGSWEWGLGNDVIYGTDEMYRIFGLIPQQLPLTYALFINRVHPLDRDYVKESIDAAIKVNNYFNVTCRMLLPNREERIIHSEAIVIVDKTSIKTTKLVGTVHDVTESKRAEAEIKMLARFTSENPNPVLRVSKGGIILFSNKAGQYLLDVWRCQINQQAPIQMHNIVLESLESNVNKQIEEQFGDRIFSLSFVPVAIEEYVNVYGIDITERRKLEEKLAQTDKLDSLRVTAAGISHQFNNILAIINSNVHTLAKHYYDHDNFTKRINVIQRATCDGTNIIRRLIEFSKSEEGYSWFVPVNIKTIIQQSLDFFTPRWKDIPKEAGIEYRIITDNHEEISEVKGNPSELREVLINVINNAFDSMPEGGTLSLQTWENGKTVFVGISDTGIGISEKVKKKIFDPFFSTKGIEGRGLGLSIVYGIMKRHGGTIEVKSREGKGSTFILGLPVTRQTAGHTLIPASRQTKKPHGTGYRILVAIADQELRRSLKELLSLEGNNIEAVDNGIVSIELLEKEVFDLVLCDLEMPEVSGWEIMRIAKILHRRPKIGLIVEEKWLHMIKHKKVNADFIVKKPLDISELLKHVAETMGNNP